MDLLTYMLTLTLVLLAPGPVTAALLVRSLSSSLGSALALAAGVLLARAGLLALAMAGATSWFTLHSGSLDVLKWLGALCLAVIAWRLWHDAPRSVHAAGSRGLVDLTLGVTLTLASPYNPVLYLTLLPSLGDRIVTVPHLVALATLGPICVVLGSVILLGRFGRHWAVVAIEFPFLRRGLAISLGGMALWIAAA